MSPEGCRSHRSGFRSLLVVAIELCFVTPFGFKHSILGLQSCFNPFSTIDSCDISSRSHVLLYNFQVSMKIEDVQREVVQATLWKG